MYANVEPIFPHKQSLTFLLPVVFLYNISIIKKTIADEPLSSVGQFAPKEQ